MRLTRNRPSLLALFTPAVGRAAAQAAAALASTLPSFGTGELALFERKAALAKRLGANHVPLTDGLPVTPWQFQPANDSSARLVHAAAGFFQTLPRGGGGTVHRHELRPPDRPQGALGGEHPVGDARGVLHRVSTTPWPTHRPAEPLAHRTVLHGRGPAGNPAPRRRSHEEPAHALPRDRDVHLPHSGFRLRLSLGARALSGPQWPQRLQGPTDGGPHLRVPRRAQGCGEIDRA